MTAIQLQRVIVKFIIWVFAEHPIDAALEKRVGAKVRKDLARGEGRVTEREGRKGSGSPRADEARRWLMHPRALHSPLQPYYFASFFFFLRLSLSIYLSTYLPTAATSVRARSRNFQLASGRTRPPVRVMCYEYSATEIFLFVPFVWVKRD